MPAEYQWRQERPEEENKERLAQAARIILKDVPRHSADFGWAAGVLQGQTDSDAAIAGMIEFGLRLQELGEDLVFAEIERQSGMRVDIKDPSANEEWRRVRSGYLVSLEGTGKEDLTGLQMPFIKGHAVVRDYRGVDSFLPVGVVENGTVFVIPQKPQE